MSFFGREQAAAVNALQGDVEFVDFEIVVVDNGSTDDTCGVAFRLGRGWRTGAQHVCRARNTGGDADTAVRPRLFERIGDAMADERCVRRTGERLCLVVCKIEPAGGVPGSAWAKV